MKKTLLVAILMAMVSNVTAQQEWKLPPRSNEKEIGVITNSYKGGTVWFNRRGNVIYKPGWNRVDKRVYYSDEELYEKLYKYAKDRYGKNYSELLLRNFKSEYDGRRTHKDVGDEEYTYTYLVSATIVIPDKEKIAKENFSNTVGMVNTNLPKLLEKAMKNVRTGSRVAIDQVKVLSGLNEDDYKDYVVEFLLDKGYKVVAKEFLQRLYEEQKQQQTGVYNEETLVQENNFSAVGYYVNIKMTDKSMKMQVVNVSTGEYEGNASVNF